MSPSVIILCSKNLSGTYILLWQNILGKKESQFFSCRELYAWTFQVLNTSHDVITREYCLILQTPVIAPCLANLSHISFHERPQREPPLAQQSPTPIPLDMTQWIRYFTS